ncbi:peptidoglycan recognition protein family protein [Alteribacillus bidgolensis]|uniref:Autolysin n=1 Tax=Alteribacillus bidgolensis TaxID=930129 RepID=A0A1G8G1U1_9BACI|nr:N-acetylmuramoyl-L-alanine amidase [Alteribacillus bidgolensis]SDH88260.1 N-acetylmuramoyl-L-alanine amidase [Alteribacillus bidgolensis]
MKIVNRIGHWEQHPVKTYKTRSLSAVDHLILHHSGVSSGTPESYAQYHVHTNNWPGIGYHYVIQSDGTVYKCQKLTTISYHTGNFNTKTVGICLSGDFSHSIPPKPQLSAAYELVRQLMLTLKITENNVLGHRECKGHETNICPGFSMTSFRSNISPLSKRNVSKKRNRPLLKRGNTGLYVQELQNRLKANNVSTGEIDGIFGPRTEQAVRTFQKRKNLQVDGIAGPNTWEMLLQ